MHALENRPFSFYKGVYLTQVLENKWVNIYFWSLSGHKTTDLELSSQICFMV